MKIKKASFKTETACQPRLSESFVEGRLSLPPEKSEIDRVLFIQGRIHVNAEPADGKVFMDGSVVFSVVYMTTDGGIDAFEASSPFRHSEEMSGAGAGMTLSAKGSVKDVNFSLEDVRTVYVKGIVSVNLRGSMSKSCEAVTGADSELQVRMTKRRLKVTRDQKRDTMMLREDVRLPQALPIAEKILSADAYPVVRSVHTEELKIVVEGDLKLSVLYLSTDKGAPLQQYTESIPFGHILASEEISPEDMISVDASLADLSVSVAEEAGDIFRVSAKISIMAAARADNEVQYLEDAYSLRNKMMLKYDEQACRHLVLSECTKAIARSTISVPPAEPSVSRIVCLKASPTIAAVHPGTDRVYIEGLMMFTLCYTSAEGMWSYTGETPFEAEVQMDGITADQEVEVNADVEYCSYEGTGRDISVKFMLDVEVRAFAQSLMRLVSDMTEMDEAPARNQGITIYFADGGETTWDIAKRYTTTLDIVKKFNPDIGDTAEPGQKILIMS